jgi:cytidylate kinase
MAASKVSAIAVVRQYLLDMQRETARKNSVIMDGRDIGTVILPDAEVKIFLTASPKARAKRRPA